MLIRIRNVLQPAYPNTAIERLEPAYRCLVFTKNSLEVRVARLRPFLWPMFDRKLRVLLRLPRIQNRKLIDEVGEGGPKIVYGLANKNADDRRNGARLVTSITEPPTCTRGYANRVLALTVHGSDLTFEPRDMLLCPTYSRVGIIKGWLCALGMHDELKRLGVA